MGRAVDMLVTACGVFASGVQGGQGRARVHEDRCPSSKVSKCRETERRPKPHAAQHAEQTKNDGDGVRMAQLCTGLDFRQKWKSFLFALL